MIKIMGSIVRIYGAYHFKPKCELGLSILSALKNIRQQESLKKIDAFTIKERKALGGSGFVFYDIDYI